MNLRAFGYVDLGSDRLADWRAFGTEALGLQCAKATASTLRFRMDDREQRIFIDSTLPEGTGVFGWEVCDAAALDHFGAHLEDHGIAVSQAPASVADERGVAQLIAFDDPVGNRLEVFHSATVAGTPFAPARALSGFRTGTLGLGHIVFTVPRIDDVLPFYRDVLGFGVSDYMLSPFRAHFLHLNARHHSLALIETGRAGIHHLMVEACSLDDVGQALDLAESRDEVNVSLGRHTNDFMTSFYARSPSPLMVEFGWGGREIDPESWQPVELRDGPSLWGHERHWLPTEDRALAQRRRIEAAAAGARQPVQVMDGNFVRMSDTCPWTDGAREK